jgi:hypothetical protein
MRAGQAVSGSPIVADGWANAGERIAGVTENTPDIATMTPYTMACDQSFLVMGLRSLGSNLKLEGRR